MKREYIKPVTEVIAAKTEPMLSGTDVTGTAVKDIGEVATEYNRLGDGNQLGREQRWLDDEE